MKFIHQSELDKTRWDQLVDLYQGDVFSRSWYLDACAEDWCVLADADFKNGIALAYTTKLGIRSISPPIFTRNLDFIGSDIEFQKEALLAIVKEFSAGHLQGLHPWNEGNAVMRVFQTVEKDFTPGKQAKRMLQKAIKNGISIELTTDWRAVFEVIQSELTEKISEFNSANLARLNKLIESLEKENRLICLGIYQDEKLEGGMIFMDSPHKCIYLKGAANRAVRDNGGMYLCMESAIQKTIAANQVFDFGGSGIEGVRRFNMNLGGIDQHYYIYSWNNAPWWFNFTKWMYQKWKKK